MKTILHVGCGPQNKSHLRGFNTAEWNELRFDIDQSVTPDITGTLTDMSAVATGSVDALYSSHNIEHLAPHEVPIAVREFHRVLADDGFAIILCPDLQRVAEAVLADRMFEPLYVSSAGPVSAMDMIYGHIAFTADGNEYQTHKCGFTASTLSGVFLQYGFAKTYGGRDLETYALWLIAFKQPQPEEVIKHIAATYLPWA